MFQPLEISFASLALLLVLHRVKDFAFGTQAMRSTEQLRNKNLVVRSVFVAVALLILLSIFSSWAASAYFLQGSNLNFHAAQAYANNNTVDGNRLRLAAAEVQGRGDSVLGITRSADAAVLLLIVLAFIAMAAFSSKAIRSALRTLFIAEQKFDEVSHALARSARGAGASFEQNKKLIAAASLEGRRLRWKILSSFTYAFVALLLRAILTLIYALASAGQDNSNSCDRSYCAACKNVFSNIQGWLLYTPFFQFIAVLLSSPLATAVALWGMSGVGVLESLTSARTPLQTAATGSGVSVSMAVRTAAPARMLDNL